jgi:hypothetical protein
MPFGSSTITTSGLEGLVPHYRHRMQDIEMFYLNNALKTFVFDYAN